MTTLLTPDQAETISKHGFSVSSQAPSLAVSAARPNARPAADPLSDAALRATGRYTEEQIASFEAAIMEEEALAAAEVEEERSREYMNSSWTRQVEQASYRGL